MSASCAILPLASTASYSATTHLYYTIPLNKKKPHQLRQGNSYHFGKSSTIRRFRIVEPYFPSGKNGLESCFIRRIIQQTHDLSLIHISEPTRLGMISYA